MPASLEKIILTKIVLLCLAIGCDKHCHATDWDLFGCYESSPARPAAVASNTVAAANPLSAAPVQIPGRRYLALTPEQQARGVISCYVDENTFVSRDVVAVPSTIRFIPEAGSVLPYATPPAQFGMPTAGGLSCQPCLQNYSYAAGYSTPMSYSGCATCGPGGCR